MLANALLLSILVYSQNSPLKFAVAIAYGANWTVTGLFVHELIHGYIIQSRNWQKLISLPCMYYSMLAPTFWSHWHMIHHRFGTLDENISGFQTINWARTPRLKALVERIRPPTNGVGAAIYLFFWKSVATIINQVFFFLKPRFKKKINRYRMAAELLFLIGAHALVWIYLSKEQIFFVEVVPWIVQNFFASSIVVTNHHPRLIQSGVGIENSCSIHLGSKLFDRYILNSGYHVEHHLAPTLRAQYLPALSQYLTSQTGGRYRPISVLKAHQTIFLAD